MCSLLGRPQRPKPRAAYLRLFGADVHPLQQVVQELGDAGPGVDAVGAVQHDDDVQLGAALCGRGTTARPEPGAALGEPRAALSGLEEASSGAVAGAF